MYCESNRIYNAQRDIYEKFKKQFGTGRKVHKTDITVFKMLKNLNQHDRERIFGNRGWCWYLVGPLKKEHSL